MSARERWLELGLRRPRTVLILAFVLLAAALPGVARLRLAVDGRALLPADAWQVQASRALQREFGVHDPIAVVLTTRDPEGILKRGALQQLVSLSQALQRLPGIGPERVTSLATEPGDQVRTGTLDFRTWLDPLPQDEHALGVLRATLAKIPLYRGTLLSLEDPPRAACVLVAVGEEVDREALTREVRSTAAAFAHSDLEVQVVGPPVAEAELGEHLLSDLARLLPLSLAVLALLLFLAFGRTLAIVLPLLGAAAAIAVTFGAMGWSGIPLRLTGLILPILITAVGIAHSIHLFGRFRRELAGRVDARAVARAEVHAALRAALSVLARPVVASAVTTAAGFLSFSFSPLPAVRDVGVFLALGSLLCLAWSLWVVPAAVLTRGARGWSTGPSAWRTRTEEALGTALERLANALTARRTAWSVLIVLLIAVLGVALAGVRVQDSWVECFAPDSTLRRDTADVDRRFGGTQVLRIAVGSPVQAWHGEFARADLGDDQIRLRQRAALPQPVEGLWPGSCLRIRPAGATAGPGDTLVRIRSARQVEGRVQVDVDPVGRAGLPLPQILPQGVERFEVELDHRGRMQQLAQLQALRTFEEALAREHELGVGAVLGPWGQLDSFQHVWIPDPRQAALLQQSQSGIDRLLVFFRQARGERRVRELWSHDGGRALVTVLVRGADYERVASLIARVEALARQLLEPVGLQLVLGGDLAESQAMITGIVRSQVYSLGATVVLVLFLMRAFLGSWRAAWIGVVPSCLGALTTFAFMGVAGIALGVATSMFGALAVGVGDDFAIHSSTGGGPGSMARDSGPGIVLDALAVSAGFGVLACSSVPTNARLGVLLAVSVLACLAWTLALWPWLASGARPER